MSRASVLIVDDEEAIRGLLKLTLSSLGFEVHDADSAVQALAIALQQPPFDLVVTDLQMPGIDGFELARRLLEKGQARKFLFMSGYFEPPAVDDHIRDFHGAFLAKPFAIVDLVRIVNNLLEAGQGEPWWRSQAC